MAHSFLRPALLVLCALGISGLGGCGNGETETPGNDRIQGPLVGQEIWVSYGPAEKGSSVRRTGRTKEEAYQLATTLRARVLGGEDLALLAGRHSNAPGGSVEGFSGFLPRDPEAPDDRDRALADTPIGHVTPVVEWFRGYWFARRVDLVRGRELAALFDVRSREVASFSAIVLIYEGAYVPDSTFQPKRTIEQAEMLARDLLAQIQAGARFEDLAKRYSDESSGEAGGAVEVPGTGGRLTRWVRRGTLHVPGSVLEAVFQTEAGEVFPAVIVSERGVFLVRVDGRRVLPRRRSAD